MASPLDKPRQRARFGAAAFLVASLVAAAAVGVAIYAATFALPFFAQSPSMDAVFGALNGCLVESLKEPRVGFAASADARAAAAFSGTRVAVCRQSGERAEGQVLEQSGVTTAAFDFAGGLWMATRGGLFVSADGGARRVGEVAPVALAGHEGGVVALDTAGRLYSLSASGDGLGFAQLPKAPSGGAQLAVNADGAMVSVVAGGGFFVYRAKTLELVRAESPCAVEFLWWQAEPNRALVQCGGGWALEMQVASGEKETAPAKERIRAALVPRAGVYVTGCEALPCSAPPP